MYHCGTFSSTKNYKTILYLTMATQVEYKAWEYPYPTVLRAWQVNNIITIVTSITWNVTLYKILKLKSVSNLYNVQYFMGTLPVNYALDLRKLNFLQKLSAHHTSVMNLLFSLTARKEFELLCTNYSVTQPQAHGRFRACVWQALICYLASLWISIFTVF